MLTIEKKDGLTIHHHEPPYLVGEILALPNCPPNLVLEHIGGDNNVRLFQIPDTVIIPAGSKLRPTDLEPYRKALENFLYTVQPFGGMRAEYSPKATPPTQ